ncbi:hypothetical protein IM660_03940 [Ruania alkalisoli]|uniref:Uncharacterized protein n=1 Tax=Ruania alkalisoli TaxID=2779775 RepID=A0A7M1SV94_9MICO|nr:MULTISPECIES: hypothetical protein [Ruania]QOR71455.1 hypothetical protein IM660_03940 [Ruania alkalisoli]
MKFVTKLLAILAFVAGVSVIAPAPAQAADLNDAVIANSSSSTHAFVVCRDWASNGTCAYGSPRGWLYPGQNTQSKFGWADADGFHVDAGCRAYLGQGRTAYGPQWVKMYGSWGLTQTVNYRC